MRLKRVFGKIKGNSQGVHHLTNSPENARDLEWFIDRYPLAVDPPNLLAERAQQHREREAAVDAMLRNCVPTHSFELAVPARDYQKIAASVALTNHGLLLADDVGVGKTVSGICMLVDAGARPALVVTMSHLQKQWARELQRFAPDLTFHEIKTGKPYDITEVKSRTRQLMFPKAFPDVVIINYHKLAGWAETLAGIVRSVIYDECQELRRCDSQKYTAAKHISGRAQYRLGLSATPIYNHGSEIFNVIQCLRPDSLGSFGEFQTEWCGGYGDYVTDPKAFGCYLRDAGLMLRRTRADVKRELPACQNISHHVDANLEAIETVSKSCAELARLILAQTEDFRGQKMRASEELSNRLRQATGIAKAPYVAEFVKLLVEAGEQVLLFGWHREVYNIWLDRLSELKPVMYTGTESATQKEATRAAFIAGESKVLLMSLRSGAGVDGLQHVCRTVVFGELDWSPAVHEQCAGRIHRDGQENAVVAYFLVSEEGADPIIADVLGLKLQQLEGIRRPEVALLEKLQVDPDHIKKLAKSFLERTNHHAPES